MFHFHMNVTTIKNFNLKIRDYAQNNPTVLRS